MATGSVSSAGLGSGLDVNKIVTQLMDIEKRPLTLLETAAASIETKISAYGQMQSAVSTLRDAALALSSPSAWSATTGSSSDASSVSVSTGASALPGNYSVSVQSLAAAQSVATAAFGASTALVGAGTLHIDTGEWSAGQTAFTAKAATTGFDVAILATDTLADVRDKINAAGAGVNASILTDASGARLVMSSSATGTENAFRISAADADGSNTDAAGLSALAFDPPGGTTGASLTQTAANASATINGLAVSSASNNLADMVQGLTLNLMKVTTTPVQISVTQDAASTMATIESFVAAFNSVASLLATMTKYDGEGSTAGILQGDSTAVSLQRQLRNMLTAQSSASTTFSTLSQVGLEMQLDGTLKINPAKLTGAMGDMAELKKLFANSDLANNGANDGFALRLRKFADAAVSTDGLLTSRSDGLSKRLASNNESQDAMEVRLESTEARMRAQYTALDTKMATLNALSTYMTQQIEMWNKDTDTP